MATWGNMPVITGSGEDYIDFANSVLYVKANITANNGGNLAADAEMGPMNLFLHSLHCGSKKRANFGGL